MAPAGTRQRLAEQAGDSTGDRTPPSGSWKKSGSLANSRTASAIGGAASVSVTAGRVTACVTGSRGVRRHGRRPGADLARGEQVHRGNRGRLSGIERHGKRRRCLARDGGHLPERQVDHKLHDDLGRVLGLATLRAIEKTEDGRGMNGKDTIHAAGAIRPGVASPRSSDRTSAMRTGVFSVITHH